MKRAEQKLELVPPAKKQFFKLVDIASPPFSPEARLEVGQLLTRMQWGEQLHEPEWKPLTKSLEAGCSELRVRDDKIWWRVVVYVTAEVLVVLHLFPKKTEEMPVKAKKLCEKRLKEFKAALEGEKG